MKPIQPLLTIALLIIAFQFFGKLRNYSFERFLLMFISLVGVIFVVYPPAASYLARMVGIARGVDLVIYLSLLFLGFLSLFFYSRMKELEEKITDMIRDNAISNSQEKIPTVNETKK